MTWGAVATVAVGAVAANQQSQAAKGAANAQEKASRTSIAEQQRQFDVTQEQLSPYREAGLSALQQQQALLGLGYASPEYQQAQQDIERIQSNIQRLRRQREQIASEAPRTGGSLLEQIGSSSAAANLEGIDAEIARMESNLGAAQSSFQQIQQEQLSPQEQQQQAFAAFAESPGQQFLRNQQERALLRNSAAIGGLGGGNVRTALQQQAFGRAQTDYANQFNRLGSLSGAGQAAAVQTGEFGAGSAANIANLQTAGGAARASGILGQQQAQSQGISGIMGAAGQSGLFTPSQQPQQTQWGTTPGSQQSSMLAAQQSGF